MCKWSFAAIAALLLSACAPHSSHEWDAAFGSNQPTGTVPSVLDN